MRKLIASIIDAGIFVFGKMAHLFLWLVGWSGIFGIGKLGGRMLYRIDGAKRGQTAEQLTRLYGHRFNAEQISTITRKSFENYYERQAATFFFGSMDKRTVDRIMSVQGLENLDAALAKGKGVIMLLSHFGFFLLPLPFLGHRGYKVNQITGRQIHANLLAERFWTWRKNEADRLPVGYLQVDSFLRPVFKALADNEIVAIAFDGRDSQNWVVVDLLGQKVRFSSGPFELARRTGAAIVPTFVVREDTGKFKLVLEPEFKLAEEADSQKAVETDTKKFTDLFARYLVEYPCHFGMILRKLGAPHASGDQNAFFVS
jgi:lauroyl/myristoyl acyltransferase